MSNLFSKPDLEADEQALQDEERKRGLDLDKAFWKPKPDTESRIRILPPRAASGASYHMKIGKHFIQHDDRKEGFICMRETYGKKCPACEMFRQTYKLDKKEARRYAPKLYGVFNVIDRTIESPEVKLYESPRTMVWKRIIKFISGKGEMSNIIDEFDEKGAVSRPGRDIVIHFHPNAAVQDMYLVYPTDTKPLGTKEEIAKWHDQIVDLIPENISIYRPIDYDVAKIKTFGTAEEREALRKKLQAQYEESQAAEEKAEEKKEAPKTEEKTATEAPKEEIKEAPKEAPKEEKKEEKSEVAELEAKLKAAKVQEAKEKAKAAEKDAEKKEEPKKEEPKKEEPKKETPKEEKKEAEPKEEKEDDDLQGKIDEIRDSIKGSK